MCININIYVFFYKLNVQNKTYLKKFLYYIIGKYLIEVFKDVNNILK